MRSLLLFVSLGALGAAAQAAPPKKISLKEARHGFKTGTQKVDLPALIGRYDEMMQEFVRLIRGKKNIVHRCDAAFELASHRTVRAIAKQP
jgi:hypothetical protein